MSEITVSDLGDNGHEDDLSIINPPTASIIPQGMHGGEEEGIRFPFFSIIHGVGGGIQKFPKNVGDFIYNGEILVTAPVEISFYGGKTQYVQNLPYDPTGPQPNVFDTVQEVLARGGNIKQGVPAGQDENNYRASQSICSVILFASKKGSWANVVDLVISNGTELLVPATWTLRKTAHWALNGQLKMAQAGLAKQDKPLCAQRWKLTTKSQKYGSGNSTFVPVLTKIEKLNDPAVIELIVSGFGG